MEVKLLVQEKAKAVRKTIFAGVSNNWADYTPAFPKGNPFFLQLMHLPFFLPWKTRQSRSCWRGRRLPPSRLRLTQHGIGVDMRILRTFPAVVKGHDRSAAMAVELEAGALLAQRHPASRTGRKEWGPMTHAADSSGILGVHDQLLGKRN